MQRELYAEKTSKAKTMLMGKHQGKSFCASSKVLGTIAELYESELFFLSLSLFSPLLSSSPPTPPPLTYKTSLN